MYGRNILQHRRLLPQHQPAVGEAMKELISYSPKVVQKTSGWFGRHHVKGYFWTVAITRIIDGLFPFTVRRGRLTALGGLNRPGNQRQSPPLQHGHWQRRPAWEL